MLISAGRHPVSGRAAPVPVEMQAIRLAGALGAAPYGLHVGADAEAVRDTLGHGLSRLVVLQTEAGDPCPALVAHFSRLPPDLILAGRRGQGGTDGGLLPYRLAHALGWPILADAATLARDANGLRVEQALPRGARRVVEIKLPCVVTVHPAAPPALPFRYAALRGEIEVLPAGPGTPATEPEPRPYRMRPKIIAQSNSGGTVLAGVSPEAAAQAIVTELRRLKMLGPDTA